MKIRLLVVVVVLFLPQSLLAQVKYTLDYFEDSASQVRIAIEPSSPAPANANLVTPRSVPGDYSIALYDSFVANVVAVTTDLERLPMTKDESDAPRWEATGNSKPIKRIEYSVNIDQMERRMVPGSSSIARDGFLGLLNYSVFGWIDGYEMQPVRCAVRTSSGWSVFSTNEPFASPKKGVFEFSASDYHELADGQIYLGSRFQVRQFNGPVPLFVASYSQTGDEYLDDYGTQGITSMRILNEYFGEIPFKHYSIMLLRAVPLEAGTAPQLAMEHLASATFFGDTQNSRPVAMSEADVTRTMLTYLHHMAHAFIPLRSYGNNYVPFVLEVPPVMDTIWLNEGFIWFVAYDTLKRQPMLDLFNQSVFKASPVIKKLGLTELSRIGSTNYGVDFRIGRALFSRGALMAIEMNDHLLKTSKGKKSMKDVIRYLYQWSKANNRAYTTSELPKLMNKACGIDLRKIYDKWQMPIPD